MTQEEKYLVLKDLCSRLPYGVIVETPKGKGHICDINLTIFGTEVGVNINPTIRDTFNVEDVKPYLFPPSSMTEEQKEELKDLISQQTKILIEQLKNDDCGIDCGKYHFHSNLELEWLLKNNFDYSGLIPMDLANNATGLNIY